MTTEEAIEQLKQHDYWTRFSWEDEVCEIVLSEIERLTAERDAAIGELRRVPLNCFCCRWNSKIGDHDECQCPEQCCLNGPDRWEWRGMQNE